MRTYLQFLVGCVLYNALELVMFVAGKGGPRLPLLNLVGLLCCSAAVFLHVAIGRRNGYEEQTKLGRRLLVFLLGGFICPACGHGKVRVGVGWVFCYACLGCKRFYVARHPPSNDLREQWRRVWRRR